MLHASSEEPGEYAIQAHASYKQGAEDVREPIGFALNVEAQSERDQRPRPRRRGCRRATGADRARRRRGVRGDPAIFSGAVASDRSSLSWVMAGYPSVSRHSGGFDDGRSMVETHSA